MDRRRYLALLGLAGVAGCLGDAPGTGDTTTDTTRTTETTTPTTTRRTTAADVPTVTAPTQIGPFASPDDVPCPRIDGETTTCAHTVADTEGVVYFTPEAARLQRPTDTTTLTLHNGTDRDFGMNPFDWRVIKRVEDGWRHVAPWGVPEPWVRVAPGGTFEWEFGIGDADVGGDRMGDGALVEHLGPGTFAFYVGGALEGEQRAAAVALVPFAVTGDPLPLRPDDVVRTERRTDTLDVYTRLGEETETPGTLTLQRVEYVQAPGHLLTEHAIQSHPLRNGLPYLVARDVSAVRVHTTAVAADTAGTYLDATYRDPTTGEPPSTSGYSYAGRSFAVSTDEAEDPETTTR